MINYQVITESIFLEMTGQALKIDPRRSGTWIRFGITLANFKKMEEAINCLNKAYATGSDTDDALKLKEVILYDVIQKLWNLKSEVSILLRKYPTGTFVAGSRAKVARDQVPVICAVIDDAIRALLTGLDVHDRSINLK